jgi:protein-L-isoaspartate(D-aspartate) O-methyltransferase
LERTLRLVAMWAVVLLACNGPSREEVNAMEKRYDAMKEAMVQNQIIKRDITDPAVLAALRKVPRHLFVPEEYRKEAYEDYPLPIGEGQTISQPYIVALMTQLLDIRPGQRVLEIGTGSGYQAAVLSEMGAEVYTIEILPALAERAQLRLKELGYTRVHVLVGDGYRGYPAAAPFDAIIVTAAPEKIPSPLVEQLKVEGRLVVPIGKYSQELKLVKKTAAGTVTEDMLPVRFVPMVGEVEK